MGSCRHPSGAPVAAMTKKAQTDAACTYIMCVDLLPRLTTNFYVFVLT